MNDVKLQLEIHEQALNRYKKLLLEGDNKKQDEAFIQNNKQNNLRATSSETTQNEVIRIEVIVGVILEKYGVYD